MNTYQADLLELNLDFNRKQRKLLKLRVKIQAYTDAHVYDYAHALYMGCRKAQLLDLKTRIAEAECEAILENIADLQVAMDAL